MSAYTNVHNRDYFSIMRSDVNRNGKSIKKEGIALSKYFVVGLVHIVVNSLHIIVLFDLIDQFKNVCSLFFTKCTM